MNKTYAIIALVLLATAFAFGRYTVPETVRTETKIEYIEKKTTETDEKKNTKLDTNRHTVTTKTEEVRPDGTKLITTKTEEVENKFRETERTTSIKEQVDKQLNEERLKLVESARDRVTISALAGVTVTNLAQPIVFGGHISKPLLGPITVGVWGLSNATAGASLGLQF